MVTLVWEVGGLWLSAVLMEGCLGVLSHSARTVQHLFDVSKPLWQVFMEACGWLPEAPGWFLKRLGAF